MNIFTLADSPILAAQWQHDRHVVKMTLETAQLLSTAVWHNDEIRAVFESCHGVMRAGIDSIDAGSLRLYKSISNPNHPSAVWVRNTLPNFVWTALHLNGLIGEYHRRFQKVHGCDRVRIAFYPVIAKICGVERVWTRDADRNLIIDPAVLAFAENHEPFAQCMPDEYKGADSVVAYRTLYANDKIFQDHVKWTRCDMIPDFLFDYTWSMDAQNRLEQLVTTHRDGINAAAMPRDPHPDLLKPVNPRAVFGRRS